MGSKKDCVDRFMEMWQGLPAPIVMAKMVALLKEICDRIPEACKIVDEVMEREVSELLAEEGGEEELEEWDEEEWEEEDWEDEWDEW